MKPTNRKDILKKLLAEEKLTKKQRKEFTELPEVDAAMRQQWEKASHSPADTLLKEQIWNSILNKRERKKNRFIPFKPKWQMIAASIVLFISTVSWWMYTQTEHMTNHFVEVAAQESQLYILPDSSKVWMKQGSTIKYAKAFEKDRKVWLSGNSLFEVKKHKGTSFKVYINKAFIEVKGTSFLVEQVNPETNEITLFNGKIDFNIPASGKTIAVSPLQKVVYNATKAEMKIEHISNMRWENGKYYFTDIPLQELIAIINQIFDSKVTLAEDISRNSEFTGSIRYDEPLEDVINKVCYTLNLEKEEINNKTILRK